MDSITTSTEVDVATVVFSASDADVVIDAALGIDTVRLRKTGGGAFVDVTSLVGVACVGCGVAVVGMVVVVVSRDDDSKGMGAIVFTAMIYLV